MAKMLSRVAPWLASRKETTGPGISIRVLSGPDTATLRDLARTDVVANVFILSHLAATGTAAPTMGAGSTS